MIASEIQDAENPRELATRGDLREAGLLLRKDIQEVRYSLLKWLVGLLVTRSAFTDF